MNILRRLPLTRLLALCVLVVAIGASATAIALALDAGPTPPPEPLAQAIHDALAGGQANPVQGVSASITWTNHLLEGASLASGGKSGELTSSPLVSGASGRLWMAKDGDLRLELQSQQGDTQVLYDGHTLELYDAATNTLYRYTLPHETGSAGAGDAPSCADALAGGSCAPYGEGSREVPSVAKIEEAISRLSKHADVSGASPTDVAGQPAYTVRLSPKQGGSLFGGVELSWDASNGVPLRTAVYSSTSSEPVIELAADEISYGPVSSSVFELNPPSNAKVEEVEPPTAGHTHRTRPSAARGRTDTPKLTTSGHGPSTIAVLEEQAHGKTPSAEPSELEGLPKVSVDGASASELRTELGTILTFERGGVRYLLGGSVQPAAVEALARSL